MMRSQLFRFGSSSVHAQRNRKRLPLSNALRFVVVAVLASAVCLPAAAQLAGSVVQQYYVPIADENVRDFAVAINTQNLGGGSATTTRAVISITILQDGTQIVWDHWEDGLEPDIENTAAFSGTTQIYGDGNVGNGNACAFATIGCAADVLTSGAFLVFQNNVFVNPRNPATILFDGRDRIGSTELIAVSRAGWRLQEGTLLAGAVELFPTYTWDTLYEIPVGINVNNGCNPGAPDNNPNATVAQTCMFSTSAISITATELGATIEVDFDGNGIADLTQTSGPGETLYVPNIGIGAIVKSTDPVAVQLLTGDTGSNYESRWFRIVPRNQWDNSYYSPVSTTVSGQPTYVYLYNPNPGAITVTAETLGLGAPTTTNHDDDPPNIVIPNNSCATPVVRNFVVATTDVVTDVNLGIEIDHNNRGDLQLTLVSPLLTSVQFVSSSGDGDNDYDVLFDSQSGNAIDDGSADSVEGNFIFERTAGTSNSFNAFNGQNAAGTWQLQICDVNGGTSGTYFLSRLQLTTAPSVVTTTDIAVPAGLVSLQNFLMPSGTGAHFFTDPAKNGGVEPAFFAISTYDHDNTSSDWGFTLLPEILLTTSVVAGWAPGRDATSGTNPNENGSPIWVTAQGATTLCVDWNGDVDVETPFAIPANFELIVPISALASQRLFDTSDGDQSGARIFSGNAGCTASSGVLITAAWGQDASVASPAAPALDLGTTVVQIPLLDLRKAATIAVDNNNDGTIDPGDTMLYTITVSSVGSTTAQSVTLTDPTLDGNTAYVLNSTELDGAPVADSGVGTPFPLDEGLFLGNLPPQTTRIITFRVLVNDPLPPGTVQILNTVLLSSPDGGGSSSVAIPVLDPGLTLTKTSNVVGDTRPGDTILYTMTLTNTGATTQRGIKILDTLPAGTSYVADTTVASGFEVTEFWVADFFDTVSYANQDGTNNWSTNWTETFDDNAPGTGTVRVVSGELGLNNSDGGGLESVQRTANLTGMDSARLTFIWRTTTGVDLADGVIVQVDSTGAFPSPTNLETITGFNGLNQEFRSYAIPTGDISATTSVRFIFTAGSYTGATEDFFIDVVQIEALDSNAIVKNNLAPTLIDGDPENLVLTPDVFGLAPGQSMTTTYSAQVNNPLVPFRASITNTARATTLFNPFPLFATVVDPVSEGGTIGDRVWLDVDKDGFQDVGEPGLSNVGLNLRSGACPGGAIVATTTTDANGNYIFDHLGPGTYCVDVVNATVPAGLSTAPGTSDPGGTFPGGSVTIVAEEEFFNVDFGYVNSSSTLAIIGDFVWSDADSDGIQDPGEPGLGGVDVWLCLASALVCNAGNNVAATTTAADGHYLFTGVTPDEYRVVIDSADAPGYTPTSGPQSEGSYTSTPITVIAGQVQVEVDFGLNNPTTYSISDSAWIDEDNDGFRDLVEFGIPNVTVNLFSGGTIIATTTSDANGDFSFTGLPNGNYTIQIADTNGVLSGYGGTTVPAQNEQLAVTILNGNVAGDNFGYLESGEIGNLVWNDANGNGVRDPGEIGIGGVVVRVFDINAAVYVGTVATNPDGTYYVDGLPPGDYRVEVEACNFSSPAAGLCLTTPGAVAGALEDYTTRTFDNDGTGTADNSTLQLLIREADHDQDFGYRNPGGTLADISGRVFEDLDEDGGDDGDTDPGIANVTVDLIDSNGNVIATDVTDGTGAYSFPDLPPGNYSVKVTDSGGLLDNYELTSGLDTQNVTLAASDINDVDFGYARRNGTASIGDLVFFDANRDGVFNGAESGIAGVLVALIDVGPDGILGTGDDVGQIATTSTGPDGRYQFSMLDPGNYIVRVLDAYDGVPPGTTLPGDADGNAATSLQGLTRSDSNGTGANSTVINLSEGEDYENADFGYRPTPANAEAIGDTVFFDADGDGIQDSGELGIGGVTVRIYEAGANGVCFGGDDTLLGTVTTNAFGRYLFIDDASAPSERWCVVVDQSTLPGGGALTPTSFGGQNFNAFTVLDGVDRMDADFGFTGAGVFATIGDTVYEDLDGNGVQNGAEPGVPGVTVALINTFTGEIIGTTTTTNGAYLFSGVPPAAAGTYRVVVTDFDHLLDELDPVQNAGGLTIASALAAGDSFLTADFGFQPLQGVIGNQVFRDVTGGTSGVFDPGTDQPIEGVTVALWVDINNNGVIDPGTDNLLRNEVTDINGQYEFVGLAPADYLVTVTDEYGVLAGFNPVLGPSPGVDNNSQVDPYDVTIAVGTVNVTADFGFAPPPGQSFPLSGVVYEDFAQNGNCNSPDVGVTGVLVRLFRDANGNGVVDPPEDAQLGTTFTQSHPTPTLCGEDFGWYQFTDLVDGDYIVEVDLTGTRMQDSAQTEPTTTPGSPERVRAATISGAAATEVDFGFFKPPTLVVISEVRSYVDAGRVVLEFETVAQSNSVGFFIWRLDPVTGDYSQVNRDLLPTEPAVQGATYRLVDEWARPGLNEYVIYEVEARGGEQAYGPFRVDSRGHEGRPVEKVSSSEPRQTSDSSRERWARANTERRRVSSAATFGAVESAASSASEAQVQAFGKGVHYLSAAALAESTSFTESEINKMIATGKLRLRWGSNLAWAPSADGSGVYFLAPESTSTFTPYVPIEARNSNGSVMRQDDGRAPTPDVPGTFVSTEHFEQNLREATQLFDDGTLDFWFWAVLAAGHPTAGQFTTNNVTLPDVVGSAGEIRVALQGASVSAHRARIEVNGSVLGTVNWSGLAAQVANLPIPSGLLVAGANTFKVVAELPSGSIASSFYLDEFDVTYERLLRAVGDRLEFPITSTGNVTVDGFASGDISVFRSTSTDVARETVNTTLDFDGSYRVSFRALRNSTYYAVSSLGLMTPNVEPWPRWSSSKRGAEYVVITPREFHEQAQRLADFRAAEYSTHVVDVEDIFNEYAGGDRTPEAIRAYLAEAFSRWKTKPDFVSLFGKGTYDYWDYRGLGANWIPPMMVRILEIGLFPSDLWLADVSGGDGVPEMAIGRISAVTAADADAYVDKLIAHESSARPEKVLLGIDNTDSGGNFTDSTALLASRIPASVLTGEVSLQTQSLAAARTSLFAELNDVGNDTGGIRLLHWTGHGGLDRLAAEGLLKTGDIATQLLAGQPLPVVTSMTCNIAIFQIPGFDSLAEELTVAGDRGAIAVFAPAASSPNTLSTALGDALFSQIFELGAKTLGEAVVGAYSAYAGAGFDTAPLQAYIIVGDPAARVD